MASLPHTYQRPHPPRSPCWPGPTSTDMPRNTSAQRVYVRSVVALYPYVGSPVFALAKAAPHEV